MTFHPPSPVSSHSSDGQPHVRRGNSDLSSQALLEKQSHAAVAESESLNENERNRNGRSSQELREKQPDGSAIELGPPPYETKPKSQQIGWIRCTILLIVEAIALGCLSIPYAFAQVGMVCGVMLTVGVGIMCVFTSWLVGEVKLKVAPKAKIMDYPSAVRQFGGRIGYEVIELNRRRKQMRRVLTVLLFS